MIPPHRAYGRGIDKWYAKCSEMDLSSTGFVRPFSEVPMRNNYSHIEDNTPIKGPLRSLPKPQVVLVTHTDIEPLWNDLVRSYHYLGYQKLLGHQLKYLAFIQERPVAALSWSAPASKLLVRDRFIGWSQEQRERYLYRIASNSRLLIMPWVQVFHLASHVLALTIRRLNADWQHQFGHTLWFLETFVDPSRFKGTVYKATNWKFIGQSSGFGKKGKGYIYHGCRKDVYIYVLKPNFRQVIGCTPRPSSLFHRPSQSLKKVEELKMLLHSTQWNPALVPWMELTQEDVERMAEELVIFHGQFEECFQRSEQLRLGLSYISGLLSNCSAKSIEPMAMELLGEKGVRSLQRFMKTYCWDHEAMENSHQVLLAKKIASSEGMITVDASEFIKKGTESVGVARQYCGHLGKVENCQSGVFIGYTTDKGYGLLDCQLYMPQIWFSDEYTHRRKQNLVPEELTFHTKQDIALQLIRQITQEGLFTAKWIGCDATFGSDLNFLNSLPSGYFYFAAVRSTEKVFLEKPQVGIPPYKGKGRRPTKEQVLPEQSQALNVAEVANSKDLVWTPTVLAEGAKGPIIAEVACLRVYPSRNALPKDDPVWLFIRRRPDGTIKYALSNAPEDTPFSELCKASVMRWPIEQCFQEGKGNIGMDHYEHRSWPAWHRHMIYVALGLHFLLDLRLRYKKNANIDLGPGPKAGGSCITSAFFDNTRGFGDYRVSYQTK